MMVSLMMAMVKMMALMAIDLKEFIENSRHPKNPAPGREGPNRGS